MTSLSRRPLLALPALLAAGPAAAQPGERPLRIVVPFPPGGSSDILARILQPELQRVLDLATVSEVERKELAVS